MRKLPSSARPLFLPLPARSLLLFLETSLPALYPHFSPAPPHTLLPSSHTLRPLTLAPPRARSPPPPRPPPSGIHSFCGARHIEIRLDGVLVFRGEINKAPGNSQVRPTRWEWASGGVSGRVALRAMTVESQVITAARL